MNRLFVCFFLLMATAFAKEKEFNEVTLHLKEPTYQEGKILTNQGGVITTGKYRIQAQTITYIDKTEGGKQVQKLIAEGDLMIDDGSQVLVGRRLEYDCITKTGIVYQGAVGFDLWFLQSDRIIFHPDRSLYLFDASLSTGETKEREWEIHSKNVYVSKEKILETKNVTVRVARNPIFYLPFYKSDLSESRDSPARYMLDWDRGPKASMRYRVYSSKLFKLFFRLDLHTKIKDAKLGVGGAVESEYLSEDGRKKMVTKNYLARDSYFRDINPDTLATRYRFQGLYKTSNETGKADFHLVYDWMSDKNMPSDFKSNDFEQGAVGETKLTIRGRKEGMIAGVDARPRLNSFQGLKQEFPSIFFNFRPLEIGRSGIISQNRLDFAYLDYVSAKQLNPFIPNFESIRLQASHELYRPFSYQGCSFTPSLGADAIFYNKSQKNASEFQGILRYEFLLNTHLSKNYPKVRHLCEPYIHYQGIFHPTLSPDTPYIFDMRDGYNRLNLLKVGVKNDYYFWSTPLFRPNFSADLYAYTFFGASTFSKTVPKAEAFLTWNFPSVILSSKVGWNFERQVLDVVNASLAWTINQDFAFKTEFRHRSRFYWRRSQKENFIMEVTRPISETPFSPACTCALLLNGLLDWNPTLDGEEKKIPIMKR
ncbi:MAG: hypothetical protein HYZ47_02175 [Simkania negevensis]|nr:hypothetical protein [Simkania negevensis]